MSENINPDLELEPTPPAEPTPDPTPAMIAILDDQDLVIGYTTADQAGNYDSTAALTAQEYTDQLARPGIYTQTGEGWTFAEYEPPEPTAEEEAAAKIDEQQAALEAARLELLRDLAKDKAPTMSPAKLHRVKPLLTPWASLIGKALIKADTPYITHDGDVYLVNQDVGVVLEHQPPGPGTEALYSKVAKPGTIAPWAQPLGAHDAYNKYGSGLPKSDPVTHNGKTWISTMNANVYEPGVYGWTEHITT